MTWYEKILLLWEKVIAFIITVAMALMSTITIIEVGRRYIIGASFPWAEELVRFLLIWLTFLGGSIAWRKKSMVFFNLLQDKVTGRWKGFLNLFVNFICILFMVFVLYKGLAYTFSPAISRQISTGLKISMSFVYFSIPLGFGSMLAFTLGELPSAIRKCMKK